MQDWPVKAVQAETAKRLNAEVSGSLRKLSNSCKSLQMAHDLALDRRIITRCHRQILKTLRGSAIVV